MRALAREPEASSNPAPYATSWEHLCEELEGLDQLLSLRLLARQAESCDDPLDSFRGLVVSEHEVLRLLAAPATSAARPAGAMANLAQAATALACTTERIAARRAASREAGVQLRLADLSRLFQLGPFEERTILLCLAPALDRKYERLYAYLQDDATRHRPTVGLALDLFCTSPEEAVAARVAFEPQAALQKARLITVGDGAAASPPLLARPLQLDDRIADLLLGSHSLAPALQGLAEVVPPLPPRVDGANEPGLRHRVAALLRARLAAPGGADIIVSLHGPYGVGKRELARAVCADLGVPLVEMEVGRMLAAPQPFTELAWLLAREAALQPAALALKGFDLLLHGDEGANPADEKAKLATLFEALRLLSRITFLLGERRADLSGLLDLSSFVELALAPPDSVAARDIWQRSLAAQSLAGEIDTGALASTFRFTPGQVRDALAVAAGLAGWRGGALNEADVRAACRLQAARPISRVAKRVEPVYRWDDLVLPADAMAQLREICDQARLRHVVHGDWGFARRLSLGRGLSVLFAGPPGTGKTMAAEVIASELGLDLYKIDLSQVVSKYIGETEKNLDRVFTAAESASAILFFDEADALFGKRSEVKDSHDRYANLEISYLLQKMEEYQGIAILASNLRQHLDPAFLRRLAFILHFPFPDEASRQRIWEGAWPPEMPLADDVDARFLAQRLKLAGGNIKNIAVAAAFLAAAAGDRVGQAHVLHAARREFQKMGKTVTEAEIGAP